jgi:hypothetical protein
MLIKLKDITVFWANDQDFEPQGSFSIFVEGAL